MKKSFILMSLMLGALALTSCNNLDSTIEAPKGNFSFKVSTDTRAGIENNNVVWQNGDKISFGAVLSGSTDSSTVAMEFSYIGSNTFSGDTTLDSQKKYDFYAFFPANGGAFFLESKKVNPSAYSRYVNVGAQTLSQSGQSMDGIMAYAPMIGVAKDQSPDNLTINLHHLAALLDFTIVNNSGSETAINSLQITFPGDKKFCGTYYPSYDGTLKPSGDKYVFNSCTVNVSGSNTVANGASFHVYVPIAPTALAANSKISFKITTASGTSEIEKTVSKEVTFTAGTISTQTVSYENSGDDNIEANITIDLSTDTTVKATENEISWASKQATVLNTKGNTNCNNYYPGTSGKDYTSTRFYTNSKLTITPELGYSISKIVFTATTTSFATALAESTWTNASTSVNDMEVTVTPTDGESVITSTIGATCGFTSIKIYYTQVEVKPLASISVSDQTIEFFVNDAFEFDGKCIAAYEGGKTKEVTPTSVSAPDMTTTGTKTITVTYTENGITKDVQYTINVKVLAGTTLDLTTMAAKSSAYNASTDYGNWAIVNGANNNGGWAFFKMGGKSATLATANPCYIYNKVAISHSVSKISVSIAAGSLSKSGMSVISWGVYVYSDKEMKNQIDYVAGGTITDKAGTFDFTPSAGKTWNAGYYYKVSWDLANTTTTNGIVCVDKITLYQ